VKIQVAVFWAVTLCSDVGTNILECHAAPIFKSKMLMTNDSGGGLLGCDAT
jgi:hypothetical protein